MLISQLKNKNYQLVIPSHLNIMITKWSYWCWGLFKYNDMYVVREDNEEEITFEKKLKHITGFYLTNTSIILQI